MNERLLLIKRRFRLDISRHCLSQFYKRHNIRWRTTKNCYNISLRNHQELLPQRQEYAKLLSNCILSGKPLCYVDETTCQNWDIQKKAWSDT